MVTYTCMQNVKLMVGEGLKEAGYKKAFVVYDAGVNAAEMLRKILE